MTNHKRNRNIDENFKTCLMDNDHSQPRARVDECEAGHDQDVTLSDIDSIINPSLISITGASMASTNTNININFGSSDYDQQLTQSMVSVPVTEIQHENYHNNSNNKLDLNDEQHNNINISVKERLVTNKREKNENELETSPNSPKTKPGICGKLRTKFNKINLSLFPKQFWLLAILGGMGYAIVIPWIGIGSGYLQAKYNLTHNVANIYLMIPYSIAGLTGALFGYFIGKYDAFLRCMQFALILLFISHFLLWQTFINYKIRVNNDEYEIIAIIGLVLMGIGYSIYGVSIWPLIPRTLNNPNIVATGYGIGYMSYSAFYSLVQLMIGVLTKNKINSSQYEYVEYFLMAITVLVFVQSLIFGLISKT